MPGGDRMGPWGAGPMTGRAAGFCAGHGMPGYANPMPGRGMAFGRGWARGGRGGGMAWGRRGGRGYWSGPWGQEMQGRWMPYAESTAPLPETEVHALKARADALQAELERVQERLAALNPTG
jgi:hypothetical protein